MPTATPNWRLALLLLVPIIWGAIEISREVRLRLQRRNRAGPATAVRHTLLQPTG